MRSSTIILHYDLRDVLQFPAALYVECYSNPLHVVVDWEKEISAVGSDVCLEATSANSSVIWRS
jgi:hypothetical protein